MVKNLSFPDLRLEIIIKLKSVDSVRLLEKIGEWPGLKPSRNWWDELTQVDKLGIGEGDRDFESGRTIINEEGMKKLRTGL